MLDAKIKHKELVNKSDISNLVKTSNLNTKLATFATKAELKAEQEKYLKLEEFDSRYFHGNDFFGDDGFQNMFAYQPTFNTLELKQDKGTNYVVGWNSKGLFESKILPLHGAFLPYIKYFGYKIGIQLNNNRLVVEQNNYTTKVVNTYIFYDLGTWQKILLKSFTLNKLLVWRN